MRWRALVAARHALQVPLCRPRLPSTTISRLRRPFTLRTIPSALKRLFVRIFLPRDERQEVAAKMAQRVAPQGDISLLQRLLGLPARDDAKELQDVVFVCIDCEANEFNHEQITEVGVSVLDTAKIDHIDPEVTSSDLISHIASAHYRIREYGHLRNKKFVKGNPAGFAFGRWTWIRKDDAKTVLSRLFQDPGNLPNASQLDQPTIGPARNVVLVGHGIKNEDNYLKCLGYNLVEAENVVRRMDTGSILTSKKNQVSLKRLLQLVGISVNVEHLHNAGNDAMYTLQALLTIATKEHADPGCLTLGLQQQATEKQQQLAIKRALRAAKKTERQQQSVGKRRVQKNDGQLPTTAGSAKPRASRTPTPTTGKRALQAPERQIEERDRSKNP